MATGLEGALSAMTYRSLACIANLSAAPIETNPGTEISHMTLKVIRARRTSMVPEEPSLHFHTSSRSGPIDLGDAGTQGCLCSNSLPGESLWPIRGLQERTKRL